MVENREGGRVLVVLEDELDNIVDEVDGFVDLVIPISLWRLVREVDQDSSFTVVRLGLHLNFKLLLG